MGHASGALFREEGALSSGPTLADVRKGEGGLRPHDSIARQTEKRKRSFSGKDQGHPVKKTSPILSVFTLERTCEYLCFIITCLGRFGYNSVP